MTSNDSEEDSRTTALTLTPVIHVKSSDLEGGQRRTGLVSAPGRAAAAAAAAGAGGAAGTPAAVQGAGGDKHRTTHFTEQ